MANGFTKYIRRRNGDVILPKTSTKAVFDSSGANLEVIIANVRKDITLADTKASNAQTAANTANKAGSEALSKANTAAAKADAAMPKSGGKFTGTVTFAEGADIVNADGMSLLTALQYLADKLETTTATANAAMPKANFSFDASTGTLNITL